MENERHNSIFIIILVAVSGCVLYGIGSGIRVNYGTMLDAIMENSGAAYDQVSNCFSIANIVYGILQPVSGIIAKKKSNGFVLCLGAGLMALGLVIVPFCHSYLTLILAIGVLLAAGTGALSMGVIMSAVNIVLGEDKAAVVSGFISASNGIGSIILAPVIRLLVGAGGLRLMMRILAIPALVLIPIAIWLEIKGKPYKTAGQNTNRSSKGSSIGIVFKAAFKTRSFWFLAASFFTCGFHMSIIEVHLYSQYMTWNLGEAISTAGISVYGGAIIAGCIIMGILISRVRMHIALGTLYYLRILAVLVLLLPPKSEILVIATAIFFGITSASSIPPTSGLAGKLFGGHNVAIVFGMIVLGHQVGMAVSGAFTGGLFAATGSYTLAWVIDMALAAAAGTLCMFIKEDKVLTLNNGKEELV